MRNLSPIFVALSFAAVCVPQSRAEICEKFVNEELARYRFGSFDHPQGANKTRPDSRTIRFDNSSRPNHYVMIETIQDDTRVDHVVRNQTSSKYFTSLVRQVRMKGCRMVEVIYGDDSTPSSQKLRVTAETCANDLKSPEVQSAAKELVADDSFNPMDWQKSGRNKTKTKALRQALNRHSTVPEGLIKRALLVCANFKDYLPASVRSNPALQLPAKDSGVSGMTH